jgi:hypothetical protein
MEPNVARRIRSQSTKSTAPPRTAGGSPQTGRTYVFPTKPGTLFPDLAPEGFRSQAELARVAGVRIIESAGVGPAPRSTSRESVQRNLYRIPLP